MRLHLALYVVATVLIVVGVIICNIERLALLDLSAKPHNLCIVSRVKDVSLLLPQFFEYHIAAGVDHFYLANHCSGSDTLFWTDFYRKEVTVFQNQSFSDCNAGGTTDQGRLIDFTFQLAKPHCKWIAVMDFDEYIFPSASSSAVDGALIPDYLSSSPLLRMPWLVMSNNGLETAPLGQTFIETYQHGSFNAIKKTIVMSAYVESWQSPHQPEKFRWPSLTKTPKGLLLRDYSRQFLISSQEMLTTKEGCVLPRAPLYIRHYQTIAWQDFKALRLGRKHVWQFGSNEKELRDIWLGANHSSEDASCLLKENARWTAFILAKMVKSSLHRLSAYRLRFHQQANENETTLARDYASWIRGVPLV